MTAYPHTHTHTAMLSTKITTTDGNILSHRFIPETTRPLLEKRTENNKKFGRLEITTPLINRHDDRDDDGDDETKLQPHNLIAGFLLDTSGSMQGTKILNAVNTIRNFVDVIHAERNGKTIQRQPIRAWIYLITFNDNANLEIPFQEITDQTIPEINRRLDRIRPDGSTSFEEAFKKQTRVLDEIMIQLDSEAAAAAAGDEKEPPHYHLIRFFETDGEITKGTTDVKLLYKMMRQFTPPANIRVTSEDYTIGYGSDVDLRSLKELSGPYEPITDDDDATAHNTSTTAHNTSTSAHNTHASAHNAHASAVGGRNPRRTPPSTLVTILKPADIGLQIGDILFKLIMRFGTHVVVSVSSEEGIVEIFEYQTHVWSSSTTLHSLFHGERKQLWIQYTPTATAAATATATAVNVKIQYENQFTGQQYTVATFN